MTAAPSDAHDNQILASLTSEDLALLAPKLEFVTLDVAALLFERGAAMTHAYFPVSGMISVVTSISGVQVESATIGAEGVLGLSLFLKQRLSDSTCVVQMQGQAWRLPAASFLELIAGNPDFSASLSRYTATRLWISYRLAACNLKHSLAHRTALWLLLMHDYSQGDQIDLTHRFLAQMLGVRRAGVTAALGTLQAKGIILSRRGKITVLQRKQLEAEACECDGLIRARLATS